MFKKGDKVSTLDDDITGVVVSIKGECVTIETEEGFEMSFSDSELILEHKNLVSELFKSHDLQSIVSEKEAAEKSKTKSTPSKRGRRRPPMEVDLHLHKLIDNERNLTDYDKLNIQLDTAKRQLEFAIKKRIQRVVFIHGVGKGTLRMELETLLRRYDNITYYDADYKTYGLGATEVYIYQNS